MKTLKTTLIILLGLFLMAGCQHNPEIGVLFDSMESERWEKDKNFIVEKIEELNGNCTVAVANYDADEQYKQAKEMIDNGVEVLIVNPSDLIKAADIVRYAHKKHVPVISYDRLIKDCNVDYYISCDNIAIGEQQAEYLAKIKPQGKYGIVGGSVHDNNSYLLHLGHMNILQPLVDKGDIEIVFSDFCNSWSLHEGYQITKNYLSKKGSEVDVIIASSDNLAEGVISALKEFDMDGKVLIAGQDANIEAIRNIVAGNQTITIYKPIKIMAYTAAEAAVKISQGIAPSNMHITINNGKRLVPAIFLPTQVVNRNNIKMTVVSEGFIAEEEIKN